MTPPQPSLSQAWTSTHVQKSKSNPPATFTLRLTPKQRASLMADAKGAPLSRHVRGLLFDDGGSLKATKTRRVPDSEALAKALSLLGQSHISQSLKQATSSLNSGISPLTPELMSDLNQACSQVADIRALLIKALGLRGSA